MLKVLATVDGSENSVSVVPALTKLAQESGAQVTLLTVVSRSYGTPRELSHMVMSPAVGRPPGYPIFTAQRMPPPPEPRWVETPDQAMERTIAEGRDFLEAVAAPLRAKGIHVNARVSVSEEVAEAIIEAARDEQADLIVMATHGHGALGEVVQGSVAGAVVRSGVAPVLLVRPEGLK